jgi:NAD(P)-dependent dehydrogenase (short-subunit alcohol dehydrogenase family)
VCVDLSNERGRKQLIQGVHAISCGAIDGVVAAAGVASELAIAVNYFGAVATVEGLRPLLVRSDAPRAVVVASTASIHPTDEDAVAACLDGNEAAATARSLEAGLGYSSSKAALARWVRRNAPTPAWAGAGIPLNAASPGTTITPMTAPLLAQVEMAKRIDEMVPMPLNGHAEPSVIAAVLVWLVNSTNTHVTGQNIYVDGGADAVLRGDTVW